MLLVVPTAGENVTHVSSDIKVQRKSLVLAKLGLSHIQFLSPEILLKKKNGDTGSRKKERRFSHLLWANQRDESVGCS